MADLSRKKRQRAANKTAARKLLDEIRNEMEKQEEASLTAIRSRKELVQAKIMLIKQQELEILDMIDEDGIDEEVNNNIEFELYANTELLKLNDFLKKAKQGKDGVATGNSSFSTSTVKLPKLEIKRFGGDATEWQTFLE